MAKSVADVLAEAREYLETHGWWRGHTQGPNGRQVCALGALICSQGHAHNSGAWVTDLLLVSARTRLENLLPPGDTLMCWNDDKENGAKDKQAVLDLFAKAEKIERAGFDPDA